MKTRLDMNRLIWQLVITDATDKQRIAVGTIIKDLPWVFIQSSPNTIILEFETRDRDMVLKLVQKIKEHL